MKLTRRIKYYLIGFGIGLIATLIIFKGRGCEWLPNERVLTSLRASNIYYTPQDSCTMVKNSITKKDIFLLLESGDVNFSESKTKGENKFYFVGETEKEAEYKTYKIEHENLSISFDLFDRDSVVFINKFNNISDSTTCQESKNYSMALYMPNDMVLEKLASNELKFEKIFNCEMECYGITEADINDLFAKGNVLFNNSYPNKKPNPLYFIEYSKQGEKYVFWVEQGATKTRFSRIAKLNEEEVDKSETYSIDWLFTDKTICDCNY